MPQIISDRVCADVEDEIVVFLIGMRINKLWKVWRWWPVFTAMPRMLRELGAEPEIGLLASRATLGLRNQVVTQYWKSAAHLQAYAHARDRVHQPAWQAFNAKIGSNGDVGIWHETYVVPKGHVEAIFVNMPKYGLGRWARLVPATGSRASAAKRLRTAQSHNKPKDSTISVE